MTDDDREKLTAQLLASPSLENHNFELTVTLTAGEMELIGSAAEREGETTEEYSRGILLALAEALVNGWMD